MLQKLLSYFPHKSDDLIGLEIVRQKSIVGQYLMNELRCESSMEDMCRLRFKNILSPGKQEVDMRQIQNCVTPYSSPYRSSVPNIRKLAHVVPEKSVTEIFVTPTTMQDDG